MDDHGSGLELQRETAVRREDVEKLMVLLQQLAKPFELGKRLRVVADYDPDSLAVKIRYFSECG